MDWIAFGNQKKGIILNKKSILNLEFEYQSSGFGSDDFLFKMKILYKIDKDKNDLFNIDLSEDENNAKNEFIRIIKELNKEEEI